MNCPYCDNPLPPDVSQCPSCGAAVRPQPAAPQQSVPPPPQQQYAPPPQQQYAPPPPYARQQYVPPPQYAQPVVSASSRSVYVVLGILFGYLGIHNVYAGRTGAGAAQLLITLLTGGCGILIPWIWAFIEVCTVTNDGQGRPFC